MNIKDLIRKGADAILSWGTSLAEDHIESVLEDIVPEEASNDEFWEVARGALSLAQGVSIPAEDEETPAKKLAQELLEMDKIGAIDLDHWETAVAFIERELAAGLEEVRL